MLDCVAHEARMRAMGETRALAERRALLCDCCWSRVGMQTQIDAALRSHPRCCCLHPHQTSGRLRFDRSIVWTKCSMEVRVSIRMKSCVDWGSLTGDLRIDLVVDCCSDDGSDSQVLMPHSPPGIDVEAVVAAACAESHSTAFVVAVAVQVVWLVVHPSVHASLVFV